MRNKKPDKLLLRLSRESGRPIGTFPAKPDFFSASAAARWRRRLTRAREIFEGVRGFCATGLIHRNQILSFWF